MENAFLQMLAVVNVLRLLFAVVIFAFDVNRFAFFILCSFAIAVGKHVAFMRI